jgi:hypothetical protein
MIRHYRISRLPVVKAPVIILLSRLLSKILRKLSIPSTLTFLCNFKKPLLARPIEARIPLLQIRQNKDPPPGTLLLTFGRITLTVSDGTIYVP